MTKEARRGMKPDNAKARGSSDRATDPEGSVLSGEVSRRCSICLTRDEKAATLSPVLGKRRGSASTSITPFLLFLLAVAADDIL